MSDSLMMAPVPQIVRMRSSVGPRSESCRWGRNAAADSAAHVRGLAALGWYVGDRGQTCCASRDRERTDHFEWLEDQQFLIQRSRYDHPELPDAITVTGIVDGKPTMHYFDPRGVHREFAVEITGDTWRFWNDAPGFSSNPPPRSATTT